MRRIAATTQAMRRALLLAAGFSLCAFAAALAAACAATVSAPVTSDIVTSMPWTVPETVKYELRNDNKRVGETKLTVTMSGEDLVFTQNSSDDEGNTDDSVVTVDATTLKPIRSVRTVADKTLRQVADSRYEDIDKDCDTKRVVWINQDVFKPPTESTPDTTRQNVSLCLPEHSYENDSSLFIWRTIRFEKGATVTYNTVIATRRDTQTITLTVVDKVPKSPAGPGEVWLVNISADGKTQQAWFATTPDHKIIAYQNESYLFLLEP